MLLHQFHNPLSGIQESKIWQWDQEHACTSDVCYLVRNLVSKMTIRSMVIGDDEHSVT